MLESRDFSLFDFKKILRSIFVTYGLQRLFVDPFRRPKNRSTLLLAVDLYIKSRVYEMVYLSST